MIKSMVYRFGYQRFATEHPLSLGFVFHTEAIFETKYFDSLLYFAEAYRSKTGKNVICCFMTPRCPRVARQMRERNFSEDEFILRIVRLEKHATLGYHGHFWIDPSRDKDRSLEMREQKFDEKQFCSQFSTELEWFANKGISHNGLYTAGWWFQHPSVVRSLIAAGFKFDFSFSKSQWFSNPFSAAVLRKNRIPTGVPFQFGDAVGKLTCVQNLIGFHTTPFPQDFVRNVNKLVDDRNIPIIASVNSHDYDLDVINSLNCLDFLVEKSGVRFWDAADLVNELLVRENLTQVSI